MIARQAVEAVTATHRQLSKPVDQLAQNASLGASHIGWRLWPSIAKGEKGQQATGEDAGCHEISGISFSADVVLTDDYFFNAQGWPPLPCTERPGSRPKSSPDFRRPVHDASGELLHGWNHDACLEKKRLHTDSPPSGYEP
jgi:hypothetical protein